MAKIIVVASYKGGPGKTTIAHHVALFAVMLKLRVLVVDTDRQADCYRRLARLRDRPTDYPLLEWSKGCFVIVSPDEWSLPPKLASQFDLIIVDTPPVPKLPKGPRPDLVVVPVDGVDAALNAGQTVHEAQQIGVPAVIIVRNGTSEGGLRLGRKFADMGSGLTGGVKVAEMEVPRAAAIKRTADSNNAAWNDPWPSTAANAMRALCETVLRSVGLFRQGAPPGSRAN